MNGHPDRSEAQWRICGFSDLRCMARFNLTPRISWTKHKGRLKSLTREAELQEGMVRSEGFEPPTYWFVANCSIQLS